MSDLHFCDDCGSIGHGWENCPFSREEHIEEYRDLQATISFKGIDNDKPYCYACGNDLPSWADQCPCLTPNNDIDYYAIMVRESGNGTWM